MSEESWCHRVPTTTWWSTSADEPCVLDYLKDELLGVVKTSGVDGLSEQLTRRLGEVSVQLRHVDVIDEEDHCLSSWWTKQGLSLRLEVALECILEILGGGLSGKVDASRDDVVRSGCQEVFGDDRFTDTGLSSDQDVMTSPDEGA